MPDRGLENDADEFARLLTPRAVPSARFVHNLSQDIRHAAYEKMGHGSSISFDDMVIELRKLVRLLCETLIPIQPRSDFVLTLERHLQSTAAAQIADRQRRRRWLMVGSVIGSALSFVGVVTALVLRRRNGRVQTNKPVSMT
ncbi:MAG: hypothetical protein ISS56_09505 [Anaerolineae bacterium]|nr:hypothetical protein [Anaerolineae bacterium]